MEGVGEGRGPSGLGSEGVGVRKREWFIGNSGNRKDDPAVSQGEQGKTREGPGWNGKEGCGQKRGEGVSDMCCVLELNPRDLYPDTCGREGGDLLPKGTRTSIS